MSLTHYLKHAGMLEQTDLKGQILFVFRNSDDNALPSMSCALLANVITAVHTETETGGAAEDSL